MIIKAILVPIYKTKGQDYSNGGISSKFDEIWIVSDSGWQEFDEANGLPENLCTVVDGFRCKIIEPFVKPDDGKIGWMDGGCICYSSDSRFTELSEGYPLRLHDRQETQEEYDVYSS